MNAFETLGLEPGTTDETVIRKAYAVALKAHRPDVDPAGFAAVRAAYQWVMARRSLGDDDDEEEDDETEDENAYEPDEAVRALRRVGPVEFGDPSIQEVAASRADPELDAFADVVRSAVSDRDATNRLAVARRLLLTPAALVDPRFVWMGVRLAALIALDDPGLAERLGSEIYGIVPPRERSARAFTEIDRRRRLGEMLVGASESTNRIVRASLEGGDVADVVDAADQAAFERELGRKLDGDPLLEWALAAMPDLPFLKRRLERRAIRAAEKARLAAKEAKKIRIKKGGGGAIYVVIVSVLLLVKFLRPDATYPKYRAPGTTTVHSFDPPEPDRRRYSREGRAELERIEKEMERKEFQRGRERDRLVREEENKDRRRRGLPPLTLPPELDPVRGDDDPPPK